MHLPFLPLCPTAAGAEAARREVMGNDNLLALILTAANSGNAEEACALAENWCATHKDETCANDNDIWNVLLKTLFPKAPEPEPPDPLWPHVGVPMPANAKKRFFDMCRRHRNALLVEAQYKGRKQLYSQYMEARQKLRTAMRGWTTSMNQNELREHRGYRRLETKMRQIERNMTRLKETIADMEDKELAKARDQLQYWNEKVRPPRVRRQNAMRVLDLNAFSFPQGPPPPADPFPEHTDDEDGDEDDYGINPALFGDNEDD